MSEFLSAVPLHRSSAIAIRDVCCRAHRSGPGAEEHSSGFSLVLPRRGVFVMHGVTGEVTADTLRIVPFVPGVGYRVSHPTAAGDDVTVFEYAGALLDDALEAAGQAGGRSALRTLPAAESPPALFHLVQRLRGGLKHGAIDAMATEETAARLLAFVLGRPAPARPRSPRPATRRRHARLAEQARQAIAGHYGERLGLLDLARYLGVSPFHLLRVFRTATGLTVHRHLTRVRLRAAFDLIAAGAPDLTAVALGCGFAGHSHLTNAFRREFGTPPSGVRALPARRELLRLSRILQAGSASST